MAATYNKEAEARAEEENVEEGPEFGYSKRSN